MPVSDNRGRLVALSELFSLFQDRFQDFLHHGGHIASARFAVLQTTTGPAPA
jgi:hypothetical protein